MIQIPMEMIAVNSDSQFSQPQSSQFLAQILIWDIPLQNPRIIWARRALNPIPFPLFPCWAGIGVELGPPWNGISLLLSPPLFQLLPRLLWFPTRNGNSRINPSHHSHFMALTGSTEHAGTHPGLLQGLLTARNKQNSLNPSQSRPQPPLGMAQFPFFSSPSLTSPRFCKSFKIFLLISFISFFLMIPF